MTHIQPKRVKKSASFIVRGTAESVFPLLCPIREYDWVVGWECELLYSVSGVAEANCIFKTDFPGLGPEIWTVTRYEPENFRIEFVRMNQESHIAKLNVHLEQTGGKTCLSHWTYIATALSPAGHQYLKNKMGDTFETTMAGLEKMLNYYVVNGEKLQLPAGH